MLLVFKIAFQNSIHSFMLCDILEHKRLGNRALKIQEFSFKLCLD